MDSVVRGVDIVGLERRIAGVDVILVSRFVLSFFLSSLLSSFPCV